MRIKRYTYQISAILLSALSFIVLGAGRAAAAPLTCTWTGGGTNSNFSTAANWSNCNSAAPTSGDSLIFDGSVTNKSPSNDIGGLTVNTISFTNAAGFTISGVNITLTGGIVDNSTGNSANNALNFNIAFSGNQSITGTQVQELMLGSVTTTDTINSGSTLTVSNAGGVSVNGALAGSGGLTLSGGNDVVLLNTTSNSFSGPISIGNNTILNSNDPSDLGSGTITVISGGSLSTDTPSSSTTAIINNALILAGSGSANHGAIFFGGASGSQLTLAGPVTLAANTTIDPLGNQVNVTGTYNANGFTLAVTSGTLKIGATSASSGNGTSSNAGTSAKTVPKTPNTGLADIKSNPFLVLSTSVTSALILAAIAFRARKSIVRARR